MSLVVGVTVAAGVAHAERDARSSRVVPVGDRGATCRVPVHRGYVTQLYFPDPVERITASNLVDFDVSAKDDVVTVRPLTEAAADGNITVLTRTVRVSVHVVTAPKEEAVFQVFFRRRDADEQFQSRVEEEVRARTGALERDYARRHARLDMEVQLRARKLYAERALRRYEERELDATDRNDDHVIVRVRRAVLIGSDAYVWFEVQNRSRSLYRPTSAVMRAGEERISTAALLEGGPVAGSLGQVAVEQRRTGIVIVPSIEKWRKRMLSLTVTERGGGRPVVVDRVELR